MSEGEWVTNPEEPRWVETVSRIYYADEVIEVAGEITAEKIKEVAREKGLKKFVVKDPEGNILTPNDFPRTGEVYLEAYAEHA